MNLMQLVIQAFIIIIAAEAASEWMPIQFESPKLPMVWLDGRFRALHPAEIDTFFDRVVSIAYINQTAEKRIIFHQATGVFITKQLLLTSFNAFRTISLSTDTLKHMEVAWITHRHVNDMDDTVDYEFGKTKIKCARQVIPSPEYETWPVHMRHGPHSPLHDLMVMRLENNVIFVTPILPDLTTFSVDDDTWKPEGDKFKRITGPYRTVIAKPGHKWSRDEMKFVSIGHLNDEHIEENRYLQLGEFGAIVDCEEWFPRQWGNFICLENTAKYPGLANGALLFSNVTLFGVGSFMLRKSGASVLVFTDVRPYWHLLHRTCTASDQELKVPDDLKP